jgi:hypothetical protein
MNVDWLIVVLLLILLLSTLIPAPQMDPVHDEVEL